MDRNAFLDLIELPGEERGGTNTKPFRPETGRTNRQQAAKDASFRVSFAVGSGSRSPGNPAAAATALSGPRLRREHPDPGTLASVAQ